MNIKEKLMLGERGLFEHGPINIVIFGDSVSHGAVNGYIDYENVYWNRLKKKLNGMRDYIPVNMINASIAGTTAKGALPRLSRDVLKHEPDLVIVCFGLNDVNGTLDDYLSPLQSIFAQCKAAGIDVVFMTPNMLNTSVAPDTPKEHYEYAFHTADMQNGGRMDEYMTAAVRLAEEEGIAVCDCYAKWKKLSESEDVTMLLANRINHPMPEMHELFAESLYELLIGEKTDVAARPTTMYRQ